MSYSHSIICIPDRYARHLVDDDDPVSFSQPDDALVVRIVGSPERVCPYPVKQVEIFHFESQVDASTVHLYDSHTKLQSVTTQLISGIKRELKTRGLLMTEAIDCLPTKFLFIYFSNCLAYVSTKFVLSIATNSLALFCNMEKVLHSLTIPLIISIIHKSW